LKNVQETLLCKWEQLNDCLATVEERTEKAIPHIDKEKKKYPI
jgi:hypothetical protein